MTSRSDPDSDSDRGSDNQPDIPPDPVVSTTVGTGSMLGIGCLVTVILLVIVAFAIRWFAGSW
ncbi:MAG: hypothetical protein K0R44_1186 [Thermomicrobiales bacterium]|jgi:hypothetical protein|nr:hypothetical protein [Thermomicrobiales bacterium]MDF3015961.1 hypothetical protein [Thermomicrobiales bacterium]